jgi:hypothetical protein
MAINQNHLFEDLNGIKCAIVEKNVSPARVEFLRGVLEYNGYTVMVVDSPPPKVAPVAAKPAVPPAAMPASAPESTPPPATPEAAALPPPLPPPPPPPTTFTVGVTDVTFNPVNAIFGRLLKAPGGHIITLAFWQQKERSSHDEVPYFDAKY